MGEQGEQVEKVDGRRTAGRAQILEAAVACFVERGYHGTSIRDIATAAGMTSAALYHHFSAKQDVLVAIMGDALDVALSATRAADGVAGSDPVERLRSVMHAWVLFHATAKPRAFVGATEIRALEESNRADVIQQRDAQEQLFATVVAAGCAAGRFSTTHPENATRALITMGVAVSNWFDEAGPLSAEQVADEYADLALAMVGADRSR